MDKYRESVVETVRIVNSAGIQVDATMLSRRLNISRVSATGRLNKACKEGLIERVSIGKYIAKK